MDDDNWEMVKSVFEAMNVELTAVMRRYTSQGSFALWDTSKPSVWLTAWVIRNLESVAFQVSVNIDQVLLRPLVHLQTLGLAHSLGHQEP
jgi:hypothetical protein